MDNREPSANRKALSMLGLAARAGKTASGEFSCERSVKSGKAALLILAGDASDNTKKKFENMCVYYEVPLAFSAGKEALGKAIGKELRSCVSVEDPGFALQIKKLIDLSANSSEYTIGKGAVY